MDNETLAHESPHMMMQAIEKFVPPPAGQWGAPVEEPERFRHKIEESVDEDVCEES